MLKDTGHTRDLGGLGTDILFRLPSGRRDFATPLVMVRAAARPRPEYGEAASRRSIEQVRLSRSIMVVRTRALRPVGTGLRS